MSLYNLVHGENKQVSAVLDMLCQTKEDFGRFRDAYITKDHLVVYTRLGGGNRESYQEVFEALRDHPLYLYDEDDEYDCTYCSFYFAHPPELAEQLKVYATANPTKTPAEKWDEFLKSLNKYVEDNTH